jgi:eukaryotic-like serine/threonine-protein kinase
MSKPSSLKEIVSLIQRSNVVDSKRLTDYFQSLDNLKNSNFTPDQLLEKMVSDRLITSFHSNLLSKGKWKGFCLGNYRILDKIARGGMGIVYIAEHAKLKNKVAVKVLSADISENNITKQRFIREAQAAAILDHENIVRVIDVTTDSNPPYIVMEYVDGISLQASVALSGLMHFSVASICGHQIALGLQHIHENGLVHRDIKPANIVLDRKGMVKILDLGIARLNDGQQLTKIASSEKLILGTIEYLAPEQAIDSTNVDVRADIYSLGATLYFLLTGGPPFEKSDSTTKLVLKQMGPPPAVHTINPKVPVKLSLIIQQMLQPSPNQRFQTPLEVAEALKPFAICPPDFPHALLKKAPTSFTDIVDQTPMPNQESSFLERYKPKNQEEIQNHEFDQNFDLFDINDDFANSSGEIIRPGIDDAKTDPDNTPLMIVQTYTDLQQQEVTIPVEVNAENRQEKQAKTASPSSNMYPFLIGAGIGLIAILGLLIWLIISYDKSPSKPVIQPRQVTR